MDSDKLVETLIWKQTYKGDYIAYDALNQLVQVQQLNGDRTSYSYDAANKLQRWESGSDYKDYTYDLRGNLQQVSVIDSEAAARGFTLRSVLPGNVTGNVYNSANAIIDPASMASALTTPRVLESYTWDAANRLIGNVNYNGDVTTYGYDGANNRVSMNIIWGKGNAQNQYPSGHPAGVRDGWETQYKQQQRNIYFANDITLSLPEPIMATDANDHSWTQSYVYGAGNERTSMSYVPSTDPSNDWDPTPGTGGNTSSTPMKTLYYLENALGSVIGLQAQDGTIAARYHYDEFGIVEDAEKFDLNYPGPDNLFGYTGLGYDFNSGLTYARARYLDSSIGRFISEDTYEGDTKNPLSLNLYTYVYNNPTRYHDPSGNIPLLVALIGKQVLNYGLDVMIGVGTDYLDHLNTKSGTFNVKASIKKNAKESIVPGLGFLKKVKKAYKLADGIKDAQKKAKKAKKEKGELTRKRALNEAKDRAGVPRSQQPSRQWQVGNDVTKKGHKNYEYSSNSTHHGRYYEYNTPQGKRVVSDHVKDGKTHVHAGKPKQGANPHKYDFKKDRYANIYGSNGDHHIYYRK